MMRRIVFIISTLVTFGLSLIFCTSWLFVLPSLYSQSPTSSIVIGSILMFWTYFWNGLFLKRLLYYQGIEEPQAYLIVFIVIIDTIKITLIIVWRFYLIDICNLVSDPYFCADYMQCHTDVAYPSINLLSMALNTLSPYAMTMLCCYRYYMIGIERNIVKPCKVLTIVFLCVLVPIWMYGLYSIEMVNYDEKNTYLEVFYTAFSEPATLAAYTIPVPLCFIILITYTLCSYLHEGNVENPNQLQRRSIWFMLCIYAIPCNQNVFSYHRVSTVCFSNRNTYTKDYYFYITGNIIMILKGMFMPLGLLSIDKILRKSFIGHRRQNDYEQLLDQEENIRQIGPFDDTVKKGAHVITNNKDQDNNIRRIGSFEDNVEHNAYGTRSCGDPIIDDPSKAPHASKKELLEENVHSSPQSAVER